MSLDPETRDRIQSLVESNDVLLFMKGDRQSPQCGFSATVVGLLDQLIPRYATVDVLSDPAIREAGSRCSRRRTGASSPRARTSRSTSTR